MPEVESEPNTGNAAPQVSSEVLVQRNILEQERQRYSAMEAPDGGA